MRKSKFKARAVSLLTVLVMVAAMFPATVFGETLQATVYVTIADQGNRVMTREAVTVTDIDGDNTLTVNDALYGAHEAKYPGGASAGYASGYGSWGGLYIKTLWGDSSGAFGYYLNDSYTSGLDSAVSNGDFVYGYIYSDQTTWSDVYCYFSQRTVNASAGPVELTLLKTDWSTQVNPVSDAVITIDGQETEYITDESGKVTLELEEGEYLISATSETQVLVPPVCMAYIGQGQEGGTDNPEQPGQGGESEDTDEPGEEVDIFKIISEGIAECTGTVKSQLEASPQYGFEWYALTLLRANKDVADSVLEAYYGAASSEVKNWDASKKPTEVERAALAMAIMGKDITDIDGTDLAALIYNNQGIKNGSNEVVYALLALDALDTEIPEGALWNRDSLIQALLSYQNENGGFGLYNNATAGVDITAMAIQALAPYIDDAQVAAAVEAALDYLRSQISDDYGYGDSNATAQVLMALGILKLDITDPDNGFGTPYENIVTYLEQFKVDGGYAYDDSGRLNKMATIQVMQAYDAYRKAHKENVSYWDFSQVSAGYDDEETPEGETSDKPSSGGTATADPSADKPTTTKKVDVRGAAGETSESMEAEENGQTDETLPPSAREAEKDVNQWKWLLPVGAVVVAAAAAALVVNAWRRKRG